MAQPDVGDPCEFKVLGARMGAWRTGTVAKIEDRDFTVVDARGDTWVTRKVRAPRADRSERTERPRTPERRSLRNAAPVEARPAGERERMLGAGLVAPPRSVEAPDLPRPRVVPRAPSIVRRSVEGLAKDPPVRDPAYLAFVRELPCCVCRTAGPSDPHHFGSRGMGQKTDDTRVVPLCRACHDTFHDTGNAGPRSREATRLIFAEAMVDALTLYRKREVPGGSHDAFVELGRAIATARQELSR